MGYKALVIKYYMRYEYVRNVIYQPKIVNFIK